MQSLKRHWILLLLPYWVAWIVYCFVSIGQSIERNELQHALQGVQNEVRVQTRLGLGLLPNLKIQGPGNLPKEYKKLSSEAIPIVEFGLGFRFGGQGPKPEKSYATFGGD